MRPRCWMPSGRDIWPGPPWMWFPARTRNGWTSHPVVSYALEHENLILTPHIGGCTAESMAQTEVFLAEKVLRFSRSLVSFGHFVS